MLVRICTQFIDVTLQRFLILRQQNFWPSNTHKLAQLENRANAVR